MGTRKTQPFYSFQTRDSFFEIPILDAESPEIEDFGVSITQEGDILNSPQNEHPGRRISTVQISWKIGSCALPRAPRSKGTRSITWVTMATPTERQMDLNQTFALVDPSQAKPDPSPA